MGELLYSASEGQNLRQYDGRFFSTLLRSNLLSSGSRATFAVAPLGQLSSRWRLGVWTISAVTRPQSSQYHHFSSWVPQGGNGTQESQVQLGQGVFVASPFKSTTRVLTMSARLIITPKKRMTKCLALAVHCSSIPKKSAESLFIVHRPHRNPYSIPPRSAWMPTLC